MILCDNQDGIQLSENAMFHDRSKHIDIRYHFIQDMVQQGEIRLHHIGTDEQVVDILTKPLGKVMFLASENKLEWWRDPLMRVLYEMDIELWKL